MVVSVDISDGDVSCTLYETGFNHFFHAKTKNHGGDLIFIQGHTVEQTMLEVI